MGTSQTGIDRRIGYGLERGLTGVNARIRALGSGARLAWTQSITRRRWLTTNLTVYTAAAIVLATAFSVLLAWWFRPFAHVGFGGGYGRLQPNFFDFQGIVPIAYTLYAFAIGVTAGVLIRRTLPAMVVTLAVFLAVQVIPEYGS